MSSSITGILGGTFDPVHRGHLHVAFQVLALLEPVEIQFMPCEQPVHRDSPRASGKHRCAMLERAVAAHPRFCVNPLEIERGGPSYSVDSLQAIQGRTDSSLALILGSDAFNGFPRWKDPQRILEIAHLVVCHRPGAPLDADLYAERRVMSAAELSQQPSGLILVLEIEANHCASSELRRQIAAGESTDDCLSAGVADYIRQHHLYRQVEVET